MGMVPVLAEIKVQNNDLRVTMEDVLRRVSTLESRSGERTTEPKQGEKA